MPGGPRPTDERTRFFALIAKGDGCWTWTGATNRRNGYGYFKRRDRRQMNTHRVAWEFAHGPIPDGLCVCHHCDNPRCVRPDHLFLGTQRENMQDMKAKGRGRRRRSNVAA